MPIGTYEKKIEAMVRLSPSQQAALNKLSEDLQCFAGGGPKVGQPSWRVMLLGIADGTLKVYNPKAKKEERALDPDRKARKAAKKSKNEAETKIDGAPDWWRPFYGNAMGQDYALKASGLTLAEILGLGLRAEFNPFLTHPEIIVGKDEWEPKFSPNPARPHWWWNPYSDGFMAAADVVAASGLSIEQLKAGGLLSSDCGEGINAPDKWSGWKPKN